MISDGRRSNPTKDSQSKQLLKMFQSESFTPDQVIKYFISTFDEPGPHQFLTNKILSMSNKFVEYYIPQFWYIVYICSYLQAKNYSFSMDGFLEELCKRSISNYLKVFHYQDIIDHVVSTRLRGYRKAYHSIREDRKSNHFNIIISDLRQQWSMVRSR